jgi:hypothetical protein
MRTVRAGLTGACLPLFAIVLSASTLTGCGEESCLRSEGGGCEMSSPCSALSFECDDRAVSGAQIAPDTPRPGGLAALASTGDWVLSNSQVVAVIDGIDHQHYVAPSGGNLLDLATVGDDNDSFNLMFQGVGFLPRDTARYTEAELLEGDGFVALQVHGTLDGVPEIRVHTRYEIRPCEPGIRVRTEVVNGSPEAQVWGLVDAWYWSGKETLPFAPGRGTGFDQAGLVDPLEDSFVPFPYLAAASHTTPNAAYTCVPCSASELWGFQTEQLSASGLEPRVVPPRDFAVLERFVAVADGSSLAGATDLALELRRQLFDEPWAELSGQVGGEGTGVGTEARATVHVSEGTIATQPADRTPWTQVTPGADGRYSVRVPADRDYVVEVETFGRRTVAADVHVGEGPADAGALAAPEAAEVELRVTVDGAPDHAQVFFEPADEATRADVTGRLLGGFLECAPLLGSPHGPSPACNRVLVNEPVTVQVPPGSYDLFATAGPFASLARETVDLADGDRQTVELALTRLPVQPAGTLSADLHVHGAASFDSTIPDLDRVRAFLASGVDVIAATDHDVSYDYADAIAELDAGERMHLIVGVETTGHILFGLVPGATMPQVIGHWNYWPLEYRPDDPYRGAIWDEVAEPGLVMTRLEQNGWSHDTGVAQMNHPWDSPEVGRDLGFARAIGINAAEPLPDEYDGTGPGVLVRTPPGASYANSDYHLQEVVNGTANRLHLAYRAFWFYVLGQGLLRAGTANSDSHGLTDDVVATPRNLVWTSTTFESFDQDVFDADLRAGHILGTNGPVIELLTHDAEGDERRPGLEVFEPDVDAALEIRVSAAPWVPVEEIRIVVNGEVVERIALSPAAPDDPYGTEGVLRYEDSVDLSDLMPDQGDAWVVVEAGAVLAASGDLDCNGIPDTGDNTGDGVVDWRDVERNDDDVVDARDSDGLSAPPTCDETVGPLAEPPVPGRDEPGYGFRSVTPGAYPLAFTNPLVLDLDGGGFSPTGSGRL